MRLRENCSCMTRELSMISLSLLLYLDFSLFLCLLPSLFLAFYVLFIVEVSSGLLP